MRTSLVRAGRTGWRRGGRGGEGRGPPGHPRGAAAGGGCRRRATVSSGGRPRMRKIGTVRRCAKGQPPLPDSRRRRASLRPRPGRWWRLAGTARAGAAAPVPAAAAPRPHLYTWQTSRCQSVRPGCLGRGRGCPRAHGRPPRPAAPPPAAATQRRPRDRLRATRCATVPRTGAGRAGLPTAPAARLAMNRPRRRWLAPI